MKKSIIFVICFFLFSCSINQEQEEDYFSKKMECSNLFDEEEKYFKEKEYSLNYYTIYYNLDYVFYSSIIDSCILVYKESEYEYLPGENATQIHSFLLKDLLTKEIIFSSDNLLKRDTEIERLKGEEHI